MIFIEQTSKKPNGDLQKEYKMTMSKMLPLIGTEIAFSNWKRSLCGCAEYPAFDEPELVILPDMLTGEMINFSGFVCYETTFVLDSPKTLLLEISDTAGSVEVFMNGETAGMKLNPPYRYDLSGIARRGKNHLAVEVAILPEHNSITTETHSLERTW